MVDCDAETYGTGIGEDWNDVEAGVDAVAEALVTGTDGIDRLSTVTAADAALDDLTMSETAGAALGTDAADAGLGSARRRATGGRWAARFFIQMRANSPTTNTPQMP